MVIPVSSDGVQAALSLVHDLSLTNDELALERDAWWDTLEALYESKQRTYFPVLCVTLTARAASPDVDVRKLQKRDQEDGYTAFAVGQALVQFCETHEIDMRTDNPGVLNNQPFTFKPLLTPDISQRPDYKVLFDAVERVQALSQSEGARVLALCFRIGREHWPRRTRRTKASTGTVTSSPAEHFFILNQSPSQEFAHYDSATQYGFHEKVTSAKALVTAGAGRFVVYQTSDAKDAPMTFVGCGRVDKVVEQQVAPGTPREWKAEIADYEAFKRPVPKSLGAPQGWNWQHSIVEITQADYERILSLVEHQPGWSDLEVSSLQERCEEAGLVIGIEVLATLVAALNSGKHVVLTGPPGTAKTTLAVLVSQVAEEDEHLCAGHSLTTATADWSTYDTIGGLRPTTQGGLEFTYGHFLEALDKNMWLVIDEMNRSNFDRAFGQLFTVLSGQSVVLPYRHPDDDRPVRLRHEADALPADCHDVVIPGTWRVIATMNNFDKSLLFELSFALMRRFAFVEVPAPSNDVYRELCARHVAGASLAVADQVTAAVEALLPLREIRELGPAVFIDAAKLARKLAEGAALSKQVVVLQVFYALLLPQFEGIEEPDGRRLLRVLSKAAGSALRPRAAAVLREVLGLHLGDAPVPSDDDADLQEPAAAPGGPLGDA